MIPRRRSKYGNVKVVADGITFASRAEHRRWLALRALEDAGEISRLMAHPCFELLVNGVKVCKYVADAQYLSRSGERIVEDVKGVRTAAFILKKKLMKACLGLTVTELQA